MDDKDLFSDIELGGLDKYAQRNKDALRAKRAHETDLRIAEFAAQPKTLEWAQEALSFCDREAEFGKDIADISTGIQDLPRIRNEAEKIISNAKLAAEQAEKENQLKIQREKEEKERQKALKKQEEENARLVKIKELDELIASLSSAPVSRYWCDEVENVSKEVNEAPASIKVSLKNLPLLDKMVQCVAYAKEAFCISDSIKMLKNKRSRDVDWAELVIDICESVTDNNREYIDGLDFVLKLLPEANDIIRSPEVKKYRQCLDNVECGAISEGTINSFNILNSQRYSLPYKLGEYIENFDSRWKNAAGLVAKEAEHLKEIEKQQKLKKKEEAERIKKEEELKRLEREKELERIKREEELKRLERERELEKIRQQQELERYKMEQEAERLRKKHEKAERAKKAGIIIAIVAGILAVIGGIVACFIIFSEYKHWFISILICIAYTFLWTALRHKTNFNYVPWYIFTNTCLCVASIPLFCISNATLAYAFGFSLAALSSAIILLIKCWQDHTVDIEKNSRYDYFYRRYVENTTRIFTFKYNYEYTVDFIFVLFGGILFSIALCCLFSGLAMAIVAGCGIAITVITMSLLHHILFRDEIVKGFFIGLAVAMGGTGIGFMIASFNTTVCAIFLVSTMIIMGLIFHILGRETPYCSIYIVGGILLAISILVLIFAHKAPSNTFKIENGVLISYGGTEEVVVIPEEVVAIGDGAFNFSGPHKNMKEVVMHDGITSIGIKAFKNCDELTSVTIPNGVTIIQDNAFEGCDGLTSITFHEGITKIGWNVFDNCDSLASVALPKSLAHLGDYSFSDCDSLKEIYIGSSLEYIGSGVFANGAKITIYYDGSQAEWESIDTPWIDWKYCLVAGYEIVYNYLP